MSQKLGPEFLRGPILYNQSYYSGTTSVTMQLSQKVDTLDVAVSCGYDTCFAVKACDGLCHLTKIMDRVGTPLIDYTQKSTRSTLALKLGVAPPIYPWVTATLVLFSLFM